MTEPPDPAGIERDLAAAIADVLARHERSMVTKWVALLETMDGDGRRGLWTFTSEAATPWDTLGMLTYAVHLEQADTTCARDEGGDEQ